MRAESFCGARSSLQLGEWQRISVTRRRYLPVRCCQSMDERNSKVFKELGFFSLKKKFEDVICQAEVLAKTALEIEEARRIEKEELLSQRNLWDDPVKSNEFLMDLANSTRGVNALKDLQYKVEEAKLILQLAEMDFMNYQLFEEAYKASVDVTKFLHRYEMFKNLRGPFDREGVYVTITARSGNNSEIWADKLLNMYLRWAEKQGHEGRVVEKRLSESGGIRSASIEFELECFYGYLSGEEGIHMMIQHVNGDSDICETCLAGVEVIPLFLESRVDIPLNDQDLEVCFLSQARNQHSYQSECTVKVLHIPTGIAVQCSGERSHFANKLKAINRLKAKLLVAAEKQAVSNIAEINGSDVVAALKQEARRYICGPHKLVQDTRSGFQLPDLNSVLDGDIEPFLTTNVSLQRGREMG